MPKEEKYALFLIGRPEDTFPEMTKRAYRMTSKVTGAKLWVQVHSHP